MAPEPEITPDKLTALDAEAEIVPLLTIVELMVPVPTPESRFAVDPELMVSVENEPLFATVGAILGAEEEPVIFQLLAEDQRLLELPT